MFEWRLKVTAIERLISIASPQIGVDGDRFALPPGLVELLRARNGFYAFESALLVRPSTTADKIHGVTEWNEPSLWRDRYETIPQSAVFFAEDIFGCQFALTEDGVACFDPETTEFEFIAEGISSWCEALLDDYEVLSGYPLAREWQAKFGSIGSGERLLPKVPFVLGGDFALENLYSSDDVKGMRLRGEIARQIRDLPDGSKVKLVVVD